MSLKGCTALLVSTSFIAVFVFMLQLSSPKEYVTVDIEMFSRHRNDITITDLNITAAENNSRLELTVMEVTTATLSSLELSLPQKMKPYLNKASDDVKFVKVRWTSVYGNGENDSYHFFTAYFDGRVPHRPVVIVMGYVMKTVERIPLYCVFNYADGRHVCSKKVGVRQHPSPCYTPSLPGETFHILCHLDPGEEPPVSVMISSTSVCDSNSTSKEIPIGNRDGGKRKTLKKFGVCVGGPVIENKNSVQDLVEFISMSRLMGAELITFYISQEQLSRRIIWYILTRYSDLVRVIEWRKFSSVHSPLHYYGQLIIISDCLHRSMYEVEYLAQIDLDEMIVPIKGNNWPELIQDIPNRNKYASFLFQNAYFSNKKFIPPKQLSNCGNFTVAKYFIRTQRHICYPNYSYRTKLITNPRLIVESSIHTVCKVVPGFTTKSYSVPVRIGILGHYRNPISKDCIKRRTYEDTSLMKYSERLKDVMCSNYHL